MHFDNEHALASSKAFWRQGDLSQGDLSRYLERDESHRKSQNFYYENKHMIEVRRNHIVLKKIPD